MKHVKIIGTGSAAPEKILSNTDLEEMMDTSDEWITSRTGIKERRIADKNIASSDLAYHASVKALESANIDASELDGIIVGTITPDFLFPSTACILQSKLNAPNILAFDLSAGCSGFLYALHVGYGMISGGSAKKLLIVGAEVLSRVVDYEDRSTCILFGDGAGAVVISDSDEPGILSSIMNSDGKDWKLLYQPGGGSRIPATEESIKNKEHFLKMEGKDVFKVAVKSMETATVNVVKDANLNPSDIDLLIPHQANYRIIEAIRKRLDMPEEKVFCNLDKYGNTSSASVPIALDEAINTGRAKKGDTVLFAAFGAGFTWGASIVKL
ncbi:MAG: beta-ketoacyl-ACP synthase III [Candidatus Dadabacteria bacterium]|nr:beta-ketoacyl-ACP synthase III [Candidatus Dadabacteria bacterium]NIQ13781.1 beta-ketoacyl-ACP synthase III [Candidatus Dadabacteria bacterium]